MEQSELEKSTIVQHSAVRERSLPDLPLPPDEPNQSEEIYEEIQETEQTGSGTTLPAENVSTCAH